ncbi:MAG: ATP-dependent DNA helicase [Parcubacteria group bacterium]|jgi:DNA helicase-2/ATP-dependent DNA helicase PcrA
MKKNKNDFVHAFNEQYELLNVQQKKAVDTIEGPVIVIAGPGTGKTQILTLRIANILRSSGAGIEPENILALTFTNAGVMAMRARLAMFIGAEDAYRVNICTFHSFCEDHIARFADYFPAIAYAHVASEIERIHIVEKILSENDFAVLTTFASDHHYTKDILWAIDQLKREGVSPDDFLVRIDLQEKAILADPESYFKRATKNNRKGDLKIGVLHPVEKNRELEKIYRAYQQYLQEEGLYDFADMIMQFIIVAEKNEEFASILREQYHYILVDEHQDTNDGQNRIIEALTDQLYIGDSPNLFTVGDDKQAIYRFQGASVENFLRFEKKYPKAIVIKLEDNYRSAQGILDEAHTLISSGDSDKNHKELTAIKKEDAHIRVIRFKTYKDELISIAEDIKSKLERGVEASNIAVFYREHHNVIYIKEVFEKLNIPFDLITRQNALQDNDIKKLITLLTVIDDPLNDQNLAALLLSDLSRVDIDDAITLLDAYRHAPSMQGLYTFFLAKENAKKASVLALHAFIKKQKELSQEMFLVEFFENLIRESGFLPLILSRKDHISTLEKLGRLFDELKECVMQREGFALHDLIIYLDTFEKYGLSMDVVRNAHGRGVQLMTAHGSKGLEFEHVYITNVVHGLWGGKKKKERFQLPIDTCEGDMEDERRLFYVAITRAKKSLTITYAQHDHAGREKSPSLFISDLSADLIDMETPMSAQYDIFFLPRMSQALSLVSVEFIRDKFLQTPLSATALNNYYDSPLKYFFRNLVRLPSVQSKTMIKGSIMHAALEKFFVLSKSRGAILSEDELIAQFERMINVMRVPREYSAAIKKSSVEALRGYYKKYAQEFTINVELEKKITGIPFTLDDGNEILLTGVVDKMELLPDGTVVVVDYKSGKPWSKKKKEERIALKRQVVFYKLLLDRYHDGQYNMTAGLLDFIEPHPQTHAYEREKILVSVEDVVQIKKEINNFAQDILSGNFLKREIDHKYGDHIVEEYITLLNVLTCAKE